MTGSSWWAAAPADLASEDYAQHVLSAVEQGWLYWRWTDLQIGPLCVQVMMQPLAMGTDSDHVFLFGMTAALLDRIVAAYNGMPNQNGPPEIMPMTSLVLDALAADSRTVLVGPFTQQQPPARNGKDDARRHSDKLQGAQRDDSLPPAQVRFRNAFIWPEGKTYTLRSPHKPGLANEYGWYVASGGQASATQLFRGPQDVPNVIQPEAYAHSYSAFRDYSMMAMFMGAHGTMDMGATLGGRISNRVDLRQLLADPDRAHLITVHAAQAWHTLAGPV